MSDTCDYCGKEDDELATVIEQAWGEERTLELCWCCYNEHEEDNS